MGQHPGCHSTPALFYSPERRTAASGETLGYTFQFQDIWAAWQELLDGALFTLWLSAASMVLSLVVAVFGAWGRTYGPGWLRWGIAGYVELIRNTPFLVQLFLIFFGLPVIGIRLDANQGALIAMVLNGSAYTIEIVRAGIEAIGQGQLEAGRALGLHGFSVFRLIVLPQALRSVVPPLGSQFILLMLNSAITSVIAADDLTAAGQNIAGRTFRSFEAYIAITGIYFVLSMLFSGAFALIERVAFGRRAAAR
jgi:polar amino acid transport system permease protein